MTLSLYKVAFKICMASPYLGIEVIIDPGILQAALHHNVLVTASVVPQLF
jgi:hypothetical protein